MTWNKNRTKKTKKRTAKDYKHRKRYTKKGALTVKKNLL